MSRPCLISPAPDRQAIDALLGSDAPSSVDPPVRPCWRCARATIGWDDIGTIYVQGASNDLPYQHMERPALYLTSEIWTKRPTERSLKPVFPAAIAVVECVLGDAP